MDIKMMCCDSTTCRAEIQAELDRLSAMLEPVWVPATEVKFRGYYLVDTGGELYILGCKVDGDDVIQILSYVDDEISTVSLKSCDPDWRFALVNCGKLHNDEVALLTARVQDLTNEVNGYRDAGWITWDQTTPGYYWVDTGDNVYLGEHNFNGRWRSEQFAEHLTPVNFPHWRFCRVIVPARVGCDGSKQPTITELLEACPHPNAEVSIREVGNKWQIDWRWLDNGQHHRYGRMFIDLSNVDEMNYGLTIAMRDMQRVGV